MAAFARRLASEGRWLESIDVNKQLIERSPRDVDALNRLGKAHFELEQYRSAYEAYSAAVEADPANIIARRSLERLEPLRDVEATDPSDSDEHPPARFGAFVEEAGKTYVDDLINTAPASSLRTLSAGEKLQIQRDGDKVTFVDSEGEYVGAPEPRLGRRLNSLVARENEYDVFVTANAGDRVRVIIREARRGPEMGDEMSFPQQPAVAVPRGYLRDSRLFRTDEDEFIIELEEDEDFNGESAGDEEDGPTIVEAGDEDDFDDSDDDDTVKVASDDDEEDDF